ncbi:MAG TPA: LAGLIDADG family homing endonuclease [Nitrososphaerales archaeon]
MEVESIVWSQQAYYLPDVRDHPMLVQEPALELQAELLALMRTKGLSIKYLDDKRKGELHQFLTYLHDAKGMSLNDVANLIGNKTSGYTSWLFRRLGVPCRPFEEARLKGIKEKRRKYERKPFDGTEEDRAYLLGLRHGDLSVSKPWKGVVRVSTSTTHPAMVDLFRSLFEPYGHVYQHPRYKKDWKSYEWNISTIVDDSFGFLFGEREEVWEWVAKKETTLLAYLAGLLDAEGSVVTTHNKSGLVLLFVTYNNSDLKLLTWVRERLLELGYPTSLCINKKKGTLTKKYGIVHKKDYWQLSFSGIPKVQAFLHRVQLRHTEKLKRITIALGVRSRLQYSEVSDQVVSLRSQIKSGVADFVRQAEEEYLKTHPRPQ